MEMIDEDLRVEYKKKRSLDEGRALDKIKENPNYFFKYSKKFCKSNSGVSSLKKDGKLYSDAKNKAEILSSQYESVWSKPQTVMCSQKVSKMFEKCY